MHRVTVIRIAALYLPSYRGNTRSLSASAPETVVRCLPA